jgi:hypothetical protein
MDLKKLATAATPKKLASYVAGLRQPTGHGHGTIREDKHNGHRIIIRTTYDIEVDGRKVLLPLSVDNEGRVHCHSLPNYQFGSAMDMVKTLIDNFPEDFAGQKRPVKRSRAHGSRSKTKNTKGTK